MTATLLALAASIVFGSTARVGDLGPEAYKFVDFLVDAGQKLWQVLPLGPTGYGDSPYAAYSAFAGNTLRISPERLVDDGLLGGGDLEETPVGPIDYAYAHQVKARLLKQAYKRFTNTDPAHLRSEFEAYVRQSRWLPD